MGADKASDPHSSYFRPRSRRPRPVRLQAHGPAPGVRIRGIEVVQAIQALDNSVRLIAGKATVVRVYIDSNDIAGTALITGELTWRQGVAGAHYLPAMNRVRFSSGRRPTLHEQRADVDLSLNFRLPAEATSAGVTEISLNRLSVPGGAEVPFAAPSLVTASFRASPPLRVRAIGLRYKGRSASGGTPNAIHFFHLRSYLSRAYPVAALEWSQIVVDGDRLLPPFDDTTSNLVNAQLSALRARELSSGMDPRTHYFGLVDDDEGKSVMRGSALYNSASKVFGLVACGPCGVPNGWTGDTDPSYADWYGAHEIGHTFQRRHPGFPASKQRRDPDEPGFPYPEGRITTDDLRYVGFDVGDPERNIAMQALPGEHHHDVMTYADRQWLSAYTYEAIHERLLYEDAALAPAVA